METPHTVHQLHSETRCVKYYLGREIQKLAGHLSTISLSTPGQGLIKNAMDLPLLVQICIRNLAPIEIKSIRVRT